MTRRRDEGFRGRLARVQGTAPRSSAAVTLAAALLASGLAGCADGSALDPVSWWHGLEGGKIAEDRPPPPDANAPYRALGDAPQDRPVPTDPKTRQLVADALVADRAHAQYAAAIDPLAPVTPVKLVPPTPPPVAAADASNASLGAASAPARPAPARPAPVPPAPVSATDLTAPGPAAPSQPAPGSPPAETASAPIVPDAPPPAPVLPGVITATAPTAPPAPPPATPPAPAALVVGAPVTVPFATGSSELPSWALPGLKLLARTRGDGRIAITGFGDARGADPATQAAAMPLALARARAVAADLLANGVASEFLRISAEAQGAGAVARLVN